MAAVPCWQKAFESADNATITYITEQVETRCAREHCVMGWRYVNHARTATHSGRAYLSWRISSTMLSRLLKKRGIVLVNMSYHRLSGTTPICTARWRRLQAERVTKQTIASSAVDHVLPAVALAAKRIPSLPEQGANNSSGHRCRRTLAIRMALSLHHVHSFTRTQPRFFPSCVRNNRCEAARTTPKVTACSQARYLHQACLTRAGRSRLRCFRFIKDRRGDAALSPPLPETA